MHCGTKIFDKYGNEGENNFPENERQNTHDRYAQNHAEAPAFFFTFLFLLLGEFFRLTLIFRISLGGIIQMLGALGAGIYNTDKAPEQRNLAQFHNPALLASRHLQKVIS